MKITWNGLTSTASEQGTSKLKPKVNGILAVNEFGDSTSSTGSIWESKSEVNESHQSHMNFATPYLPPPQETTHR